MLGCIGIQFISSVHGAERCSPPELIFFLHDGIGVEHMVGSRACFLNEKNTVFNTFRTKIGSWDRYLHYNFLVFQKGFEANDEYF